MSRADEPVAEADERTLVITRLLAAPRSRVFEAWTKPELVALWWGPRDFTTPSLAMDFRPGGAFRSCIRSADGKDYWMRGVYQEIVAPERIVFTFAWEEEGERGLENLITVTFADEGDGTRLTFRQAPFQSTAERDSHHEGWSECIDRLERHLAAA